MEHSSQEGNRRIGKDRAQNTVHAPPDPTAVLKKPYIYNLHIHIGEPSPFTLCTHQLAPSIPPHTVSDAPSQECDSSLCLYREPQRKNKGV